MLPFLLLLSALLLSLVAPHGETPVPIVDVTGLLQEEDGDESGQVVKSVLEAIDEALQSQGIFLLTAEQFKDPEYFSGFLGAAQALFNLKLEDKESVSIESNELRGYLPIGSESGLEAIYEPKEGFAYGFDWTQEEARSKTNDMQVDNIWPISFQKHDREKLDNFLKLSSKLAAMLCRFLEVLLHEIDEGKSNTLLSSVANDGDTISLMRLFHYLPADHSNHRDILGSSPHTDWGYLTLILQDSVGGLQFLRENDWIDVPTIPGTLVVNGGDFLHLLSKGRYKSPIHRVICPTYEQGERYSYPMFVHFVLYVSYIGYISYKFPILFL